MRGKVSDQVKRGLVRGANNGLRATLKTLERSTAQMGEVVHRTTIALTRHNMLCLVETLLITLGTPSPL